MAACTYSTVESLSNLCVLVCACVGRGWLPCFHHSVRKSESRGADANHRESAERNPIRNPTAARLCRWLERAEQQSQERIPIFSVNMPADGLGTSESS